MSIKKKIDFNNQSNLEPIITNENG